MSSPLSNSAFSGGSSSSWKRTLWFLPFSVLLEFADGFGGLNSSFLQVKMGVFYEPTELMRVIQKRPIYLAEPIFSSSPRAINSNRSYCLLSSSIASSHLRNSAASLQSKKVSIFPYGAVQRCDNVMSPHSLPTRFLSSRQLLLQFCNSAFH